MHRRMLLAAGIVTGCSLSIGSLARAAAVEPMRDVTFAEDFDELWHTLDQRYCFFTEKRTDWNRVRTLYRPQALAAQTQDEFAQVVRRVLAELYDTHTHMSASADGDPRWPFYDLVAERAPDGGARIVAVDADSAAALAGIAPGDRVLAIDGRPVEAVVRELMPRCLSRPDPEADAYALNSAVSGRRGMPRTLRVETPGKAARDVSLPLRSRAPQPDIEWKRLDGRTGYIVIRSFADDAVAEGFDRALADLRDTDGLVIDVRRNGGGDTAVARPIMGRFIDREMPYATMRRREGGHLGAPWTERVEPRGPFTRTGPVVVLTGHWSGSMAEGFPMGMRAIGRARIVGTRMMGLGAAVFPLRLDRTGIEAQYSAEPVYDPQGHPRWQMRPDVEVPEGQDILAAGLRTLEAMRG